MNAEDSPQPANPGKQAESAGTPSFDETMILQGDTSASPESGSPESGMRSQPESWVGRRLGKYEITEVLGVGGMGVVLKAFDSSIERHVAIKVLPAELSSNEVALDRFLSEARSAGKLSHPNTVTIYEVAEEASTHYLVMEVVSGGSTEQHLEKRGAYSVAEATRLAIEACQGLTAAHEEGLIHRDIKPANLLLTQTGSIKISDFGLAKRTHDDSLQMTKVGQILGTPYFMSPEQWESKNVDARSDIYSLGATYYSLLTGKNPYADSGSVIQVMYAHCNSAPPDPREIRTEVPAACAQIIERAMARNPADRYQSAAEMRKDLEAVLAAISGAGITLPSQSSTNLSHTLAQSKASQSSASPSGASPSSVANSQSGSRPVYWMAAAAAASVLLIVGALLFFGSGSRGGDHAGQSKTDTNEQDGALPVLPAPSGEPIKIGILHSLSGTMAESEKPVVDATLLAVEELNQQGGLLGRPVEAIVADGRSDATIFAREAKRLINEEEVCTIFGCWTSASRKTVVPIFEELDHLLVYPLQYEGIEESPNVVYLGAAPNQQIIPAVKWAYAFENRRKFFLVGSDYVFPRVAHEIIKDQLTQLGAELVGEEFLPLGSHAVEPIIEKIQEASPDVILNCINGDSNATFFAQLRAAGITAAQTPTISFSIDEAELKQLDPESMAGDYTAWNYFQSIDSPENGKFIESFQARYGPDRVVTDPMEAAYCGVKLWAQAVQEAESTETSSIRRAMRNQRLNSPSGKIRIDPATQHTFKTPRIGRLLPEGTFEIVWTSSQPEPPQPYPDTRTAEQWHALLHDLYSGWGNQWAAPQTAASN